MAMDMEKEGRKDNGRHRSVRFDKWIHDEIEALAKERNLSFTDMVNHLLEYQLNELGLTKALYDAKNFNLNRSGNKIGGIKISNNGKMGDVSAKTGDIWVDNDGNEAPSTPVHNMGKYPGEILEKKGLKKKK